MDKINDISSDEKIWFIKKIVDEFADSFASAKKQKECGDFTFLYHHHRNIESIYNKYFSPLQQKIKEQEKQIAELNYQIEKLNGIK